MPWLVILNVRYIGPPQPYVLRPLPSERGRPREKPMEMKRIAVGTSDGVSVCEHLAKSSAFIVIEAKDDQIVARWLRQRSQGACGNHASFVELLQGCSAVLCGAIGQGAADVLTAHGVEPVVTTGKHSVEEAAALYLQGKLETTSERVCLCH